MPTAEEIIVALKSQGGDRVQSQLDATQTKVDETKQGLGNAADEMQGFAESFSGALGVALTGLSVAAGGLLSMVPSVSTAFSGLFAVIQAVAFQLDKVLRPILNPITQGLFDLSGAIFKADGAVGTLIGSITSALAILGPLAVGIAKVASMAGLASSTTGALGAALTAVAGVIGTVVSAIVSIPGAIALAVAAVVGFAAAYITNFKGVRDKTNKFIGQIIGFLTDLGEKAFQKAKQFVNNLKKGIKDGAQQALIAATSFIGGINDAVFGLVDGAVAQGETFISNIQTGIQNKTSAAVTAISTVLSDIKTEINNLVSDAKALGKDLIQSFVKGIKTAADDAKAAIDETMQDIRDRLPGSDAKVGPLSDLSDTGPAMVETFAQGMRESAGQASGAADTVAGSANPQEASAFGGFSAGISESAAVYLDGTKLNDELARYRKDETSIRGRDA